MGKGLPGGGTFAVPGGPASWGGVMNSGQAQVGVLHLRHRWRVVEAIGHVVTQRCEDCYRTRVRVHS
ncbi:hypothetical protein DQ384_36905 [Sphaerisporangium album]|uniref:Uncharacterized protein n=2 Tax=Sphaerisporangium album TaxID=509200 RepID=A0A367EUY9_9ACTN|nr:hypothetical protein DQ384_36905 [Sphaerisporangium album]